VIFETTNLGNLTNFSVSDNLGTTDLTNLTDVAEVDYYGTTEDAEDTEAWVVACGTIDWEYR